MRIVGLLIIFILSLEAKEHKSCYTVQLFSLPNSQTYRLELEEKTIPSLCMVMEIGKKLTVRCGCFERIDEVKDSLKELKKEYKLAYIASTYKYRFENSNILQEDSEKIFTQEVLKKQAPLKVSPKHIQSKVLQKDEELRVMLQTFIYSNDLDYAYKTASLGYSMYPKSEFWNQKMAEILKWSGRKNEAIKYMRFIYSKTQDKALEEELINYGLSAYQYESIEELMQEKVKREPTLKNVDSLVFIYDKIGSPEKAAQFLFNEYSLDNTKTSYLTKALQIYIDMGDLEETQKIVDVIDKQQLYNLENVKIISYFYYLQRDVQSSYDVLNVVFEGEKDLKYYLLKSDLGWYLQEYKEAALASEKIIAKNEGRLVDFERVIQVNKDLDNKKSFNTSLEAYKKYNLSYLFYTFSSYAFKEKKYDELKSFIDKIDKSDSTIKNDSHYWLMKSEVYTYYNNKELSKKALMKSLEISPNSLQIQLTAISLYIKYDMYNELRELLQKIAQKPNLDTSMYYTLASAYFYIHDTNRAAFYADKLREVQSPIVKTLDYKFLQADIFSSQNNQNAFLKTMYEIESLLEENELNNPQLRKNNEHLNNYLRVALYTMDVDTFKNTLEGSKTCLSEYNYDNLSYAFAMMHEAKEEAHVIYERTKRKAPWLKLTNAIQDNKHTEIEDLLEAYLKLLPVADSSQAAYNDGQISLSQTIVFESLQDNDASQNAYIQHLNLSKERSDKFSSKMAYLVRDPLVRKYIELDNSLYMQDGLYIQSGVNYYLNSKDNTRALLSVPEDSLEVDIGFKKIFQRGYIEVDTGYVSSEKSYFKASLKGAYKLNNNFSVSSEVSKNANADESIQLLLAGKKDILELGFLWNIMPSTSFEVAYAKNKYSSQDDVDIGDGDYIRANLGHQIRNGYPDMRVGIFYDTGFYNVIKSSFRGVLDELNPKNNRILPRDFYNYGLNFAYGMTNSNTYTRVWRPYFDVITYYNSDSGTYNYGMNLGYGGKVFAQDHLQFGASYSESVYGSGGKVFEVFLKYHFLYIHPKLF